MPWGWNILTPPAVGLQVGICLGRRDASQPGNHSGRHIQLKIGNQMPRVHVLYLFSLPAFKIFTKMRAPCGQGSVCFVHGHTNRYRCTRHIAHRAFMSSGLAKPQLNARALVPLSRLATGKAECLGVEKPHSGHTREMRSTHEPGVTVSGLTEVRVPAVFSAPWGRFGLHYQS